MKVSVKSAVYKSCSALSHSCIFYSTLINIFIIKKNTFLNVSAVLEERKKEVKGK